MSFVEIDQGGTGLCVVPSGGSDGYGYAAGAMHQASRVIRSVKYAPCNGIITFDLTTGVYTLCHFPPGGPKGAEQHSYVGFLQANANKEASHVWVVGGFPTRLDAATAVFGPPHTLLTAAGLAPSSPWLFTGPPGRACDVSVGSWPGFSGLEINTRAGLRGATTTQISWASLIPS